MRLIKLRANKDSFNQIEFNKSGISIILGKKHETESTSVDKKDTFNSLGKSLSIALIHFCLGSSKNPEFEKELSDWIFYLDIEIDDVPMTIARHCNRQEVIILNEVEYSVNDFKNYLEPKVFNLPEPFKGLTFRSLISRFIRPKRSSYTSYWKYIDKEPDYNCLLNNSFLLGISKELVQKKYILKDDHDLISSRKKAIEKDSILKEFFTDEDVKDVDIKIIELKDELDSLSENIDSFKIAEDYHDIVQQADKLKRTIKSLENELKKYKFALDKIEKSLGIKADVNKTKILKLYEEASVYMPEELLRKLDEVEEFNKNLLDNRSRRLSKEKGDIQASIDSIERDIYRLGNEKNEKLSYLSDKGALDEFTKLTNRQKNLSIQLEKLERYKRLLAEFSNRLELVNQNLSSENIKTNNYLDENSNRIDSIIRTFRTLANNFYNSKKAGITIENNTQLNKSRFNISAKIDDDKGDGVGFIKIFCFDWTLFKLRKNHSVDFLIHDGRILAEIDPRQVSTLFEVAHSESKDLNVQYIINANENNLEEIKELMEPKVYQEIIEDNIVLELTDESERTKLLGIHLDFDYDKEA